MVGFYILAHILLQLQMWTCCRSQDFFAPKILYPDKAEAIYYTKGCNVSLQCNVTDSANVRYNWTKNEIELENSSKVTFSPASGLLDIFNFTTNENGKYRCRVMASFVEDIENRTVTIISPWLHLRQINFEDLKATDDLSIIDLPEYTYTQLDCFGNQQLVAPAVTYTWYEAGTSRTVNLNGGRLYIDVLGQLHFTYVLKTDEDTGGFFCVISTRLGNLLVSRTSHITKFNIITHSVVRVSTKPECKFTFSEIKTTSTFTAVLECLFSGFDFGTNGIPFQYWLDGSNQPLPINTKYLVSNDGRRLTIYNIMMSDSQTYRCVAKTSTGEAHSDLKVTITAWPGFFTVSPIDQVALEESDVMFKCKAKSHFNELSMNRPIWYFNGQRITPNGVYNISDHDTTLTIRKAKKESHIGCVQCEIPCENNECLPSWANGCLFVLKRIRVQEYFRKVVAKQKGYVINLTVSATTDPNLQLKYEWLINDTCLVNETMLSGPCENNSATLVIDTSRTLSTLLTSLRGKYKLFISNKFDRYTSDAIVTISPSLKSEEASPAVLVFIILLAILILVIVNSVYIYKVHRASKAAQIQAEFNTLLAKPQRFQQGAIDTISTYIEDQSIPSTSVTRETD